jgi:Cu(I)/Ag(I) efflux system membrane fusion protein
MSYGKSMPGWNQPNDMEPLPIDEGGLRAPPGLTGWRKAWWWFDFIILVKLARLRFIAVLVAIGFVITQWDTLAAYYDRWSRPGQTDLGGSSDVEWFCPMHPAVVRDNSKDKCPVCFMPLSKRKKGDGKEEILPAGVVNRVQLSPYRVVLAGVQTWQVDEQPLTKEITAVGFVEFNERGQRKLSARVKGRIDQLFVSETGQMVEAGDVLASLYSPDLNVTVQNLVDAHRSNNASMERSARTRLQLLGISDDQIDEILASGKSNTHLKIRSPISGHVIKKYVLDGDYVDEGSPLYEIADLSTVWIQAQVYEDDLAFLPAEQIHATSGPIVGGPKVIATTRAFPNEPFEGSLAFVYPHVDQDTRTVTVRCEVPNPGHKLRPGTTATVKLMVPAQQVAMLATAIGDDAQRLDYLSRGLVLAVPETSVIDTGSQTIVYRETLPGVYEGTRVELGPKMTGPDDVTFFPVLKGLTHGNRIVTAGSFLVDAETRLNPAAGSIYFGGSGGSKSGSSVTSARPSTPEDPDAKIQAVMASLSAEDRKLVESQRFCPVLTTSRLGSMGAPIKLQVDGQTVFVCCDACKDAALGKPAETLAKVAKLKQGKSAPAAASPPGGVPDKVNQPETIKPAAPAKTDEVMNAPGKGADAKIQAALAKLSVEDRKLAESQNLCPVLETSRLGSMGKPVKIMVDGKPVFLCCEACREDALANPKETLDKINKLKSATKSAPAK